jgi:hypothetical protein
MRRCNDIYEIVTVYYPSSCFTTTRCPATTTTTSSTFTSTTTTTTTQAPSLKLTFDDIANANTLVGDAYNVEDWNTFFDLPTYGNPFTSVEVVGNEVRLFGGSDITLRDSLFDLPDDGGIHLIEIIDDALCVIAGGFGCFGSNEYIGCPNLTTAILPAIVTLGDYFFPGCTSLTTVDLPLLTTAGDHCFYECSSLTTISLPLLTTASSYCFYNCTSLTTIDLPLLTSLEFRFFSGCISLTTISLPLVTIIDQACFHNCDSLTTIDLPACTDLGGTVGYDYVFIGINDNTITLTVPSALMTCNGGFPDGDIQYLQANNTVTIITT